MLPDSWHAAAPRRARAPFRMITSMPLLSSCRRACDWPEQEEVGGLQKQQFGERPRWRVADEMSVSTGRLRRRSTRWINGLVKVVG